jgi:AraC-like DNA-binding protein
MVLDPRSSDRDGAEHDEGEPSLLLTLLTEFRSVPAILYSAHSREGLRAVLPLARSGAHQVIFRGFDDTRDRLRGLLDQVTAGVLGERILAVVLPRLESASAPAEMVQAVARLFRAPQAFRTVHQLAAVSGRRRGQLDRWMLKAGLAPAKMLMLAARVAWTFHYLRAPGNRFKTLALRLGYVDTAALGRHVKWMTGMTPSQIRRGVTADTVFEILLRHVVR